MLCRFTDAQIACDFQYWGNNKPLTSIMSSMESWGFLFLYYPLHTAADSDQDIILAASSRQLPSDSDTLNKVNCVSAESARPLCYNSQKYNLWHGNKYEVTHKVTHNAAAQKLAIPSYNIHLDVFTLMPGSRPSSPPSWVILWKRSVTSSVNSYFN